MGNFNLDINKAAIKQITRKLETAVGDAVHQRDIDYAGQQIQSAILLRTSRGKYLTDTTGGSAKHRNYRSESYKEKRRKRGLPTNRVTLFFGEVGVLEAMRYRGAARGGEVSLEVGYISGLSEARATEIAGYLNDQGAGINKVIYRYIGLTTAEERSVVSSFRKRIAGNITNQANN